MVKFEKPEVIYDEKYDVYKWENSWRGRAYPYVLGTSVALIIILTIIMGVL